VAGLTIPDLRAQPYGAGEITIGDVYLTGPGSTTYRITYPAGDLTLTGLLHVPDGDGPFPVLIANRGYIAPERYQPGMDSRTIADFMVRNGYLVVALLRCSILHTPVFFYKILTISLLNLPDFQVLSLLQGVSAGGPTHARCAIRTYG
jgi:hypothetical protein